MVRTNSFLLSVPFAVIVYLHRNLDWHGRLRLRQSMLPVAVLMGIGVIVLIERLAYADPAWTAYLRFNHLRSQVYDYCGLPAFDENQALYQSIGVSRETYQLLSLKTLTVHDAGNSETFGAIVDSCWAQRGPRLQLGSVYSRASRGLPALLQNIVYHGYAVTNIAWIVLAAWALIGWKSTFTYRDALFFLAFVGIHFGEWLYLVINGRYPDRVISAIYLIELLVLAALAIKNRALHPGEAPRPHRLVVFLLGAVVLVLLGATYHQTGMVRRQVQSQRGRNRICEKADAYSARHPQFFYFGAPPSFSGCSQTFKIRTNNRFLNYSNLGGWGFSSPLRLQSWTRHGITDVKHDLIERDDVFIWAIDPGSIELVLDLLDYYHSISLNAVATEVDRFDTGRESPGVTVFKLHIRQDSLSR